MSLLMVLGITTQAQADVRDRGGWFESAYMSIDKVDGATLYKGYYKDHSSFDFIEVDPELVRVYGDYVRLDVVGLKAGTYDLEIRAFSSSTEIAEHTVSGLKVTAHDRSGFAHVGMTGGIGAYKNDGTLKAGTKVLYVTAKTASTIQMDVVTNSKGGTTACTGLQSIIDAYSKGYETTPLDIRIIGKIEKSDLDHISSSAEGLQVKGKGVYSDMPITIEGIGNDATVQGFGFLVRNCHGWSSATLPSWYVWTTVSLSIPATLTSGSTTWTSSMVAQVVTPTRLRVTVPLISRVSP